MAKEESKLTSEQIQQITIDLLLTPDDPPRVRGPAADALRRRLTREHEEMRKRGVQPALPEEWPE